MPITKTPGIKDHLNMQAEANWNKFAKERAKKQEWEQREAYKKKAIEKAIKRFGKLLVKAKKCKEFPASNYTMLDVVSCALGGKRAVVSAAGTVLLGHHVIGTVTKTSLGLIETIECHSKWNTWLAHGCAPSKELHFSVVGLVRLTSDNCPGFPSRIA